MGRFMKKLLRSLLLSTLTFVSLNSMALTCDESVVEQVKDYVYMNNENAVVDNASVSYLGEGIFEVYVQISDVKDPNNWVQHNYYEAAVDAQCRVHTITLFDSHL